MGEARVRACFVIHYENGSNRRLWQSEACLTDEQAVPIDQLYTSTYFQLKREYAQACCDDYLILSAKFGLVPPEALVAESYDLTVHDLDGDALTEWVARNLPVRRP